MYSSSVQKTVIRISVFFCLSIIAVILGESEPNSEFTDFGSEDGDERPSPRRGTLDPEVSEELEGNGWLDVIPGTPGKDYPNYAKIPETSFTCDGKTAGGYYADIEARCQVFHVCDTAGLKNTFVCPSGSIFNQKYFVCDWWYDFECDDATDLYSLNDNVNRGGTGSGPSGPGRIEDNFENQAFENRDLSLAGTGEGGLGYPNSGNNGYQSNFDDGENERRLFHGKKEGVDEVATRKVVSEPKGTGHNFRTQNSGINYRSGYGNARSDGAPKTDHFRYGNSGGNGFDENRNNPSDSNTQGENDYDQRLRSSNRRQSPASSDNRELSITDSPEKLRDDVSNPDGTSASSSGSNYNGYRIPAMIRGGIEAKVVRGRQRNSGGLPGGLGNGYPSPGRSRELPGSDGIASAITPAGSTAVYDEGDQRFPVVNSRHRPSPGSGTPGGPAEPGLGTDSQKIQLDRGDNAESTINRRSERRDDDSESEIDSYDNQLPRNRKYSGPDRRYQHLQNSGKNYPDDYLVGIVPGEDGTSFGQSNKPRRYLPIL